MTVVCSDTESRYRLYRFIEPPCSAFLPSAYSGGDRPERVIIVEVANKADFLASVVELAHSESCEAILAWQ